MRSSRRRPPAGLGPAASLATGPANLRPPPMKPKTAPAQRCGRMVLTRDLLGGTAGWAHSKILALLEKGDLIEGPYHSSNDETSSESGPVIRPIASAFC
jgi:hypothetical protein